MSERFNWCFTLLEVPVIVSIAFVGGRIFPPLPPPPAQPLAIITTMRRTANTDKRVATARCSENSFNEINISSSIRRSGKPIRKADSIGVSGNSGQGTTSTFEVLLTVTVKAKSEDPLGGTDAGETEQVEAPTILRARGAG